MVCALEGDGRAARRLGLVEAHLAVAVLAGGKIEGNEWRHYTLTKQAKQLRALDFEVTSAEQLRGLRGFADKSIQKIDELLQVR